MKCCDISISDFSERITVQERSQTPDGQGGFTDSWSAIDSDSTDISARVKPMSGAESRQAARVAPRATYIVHIYYRADGNGAPFYTPKHRVIWRGRTYNVLHTADVDSASLFMYVLLNEGELS